MIDEKRLEQEYRKLQEKAAPDLWDRIEGRLKEHPEREVAAGPEYAAEREVAAESEYASEPKHTGVWRRYQHGFAAAAAVIAFTVGVTAARNSGNRIAGSGAGVMEETMAAATTAAATEAAAAEGNVREQGPVAESGVAVVETEGVVTWQQLSVAEYTALPVPEQAVTVPEDSLYFSEDILADTGLLCGAMVNQVWFEYDSLGKAVKVVYELTVDEVYYAEDYIFPADQIQVKSPIVKTEGDEAFLLYQLQEGSAYLLPLKRQEGAWELLYPFAPQVQVLKDGGYLFHSGYTSLTDGQTMVVIGQQEAANDYYYDRMLFRDDDSFLSDFLTLVEH